MSEEKHIDVSPFKLFQEEMKSKNATEYQKLILLEVQKKIAIAWCILPFEEKAQYYYRAGYTELPEKLKRAKIKSEKGRKFNSSDEFSEEDAPRRRVREYKSRRGRGRR